MLDLAAGESLNTDRWLARGAPAAQAFAQNTGGWLTARIVDGLPVLSIRMTARRSSSAIPSGAARKSTSPHRQRQALGKVIASTGGQDVWFSDLYELDRQPLAVLGYLT